MDGIFFIGSQLSTTHYHFNATSTRKNEKKNIINIKTRDFTL